MREGEGDEQHAHCGRQSTVRCMRITLVFRGLVSALIDTRAHTHTRTHAHACTRARRGGVVLLDTVSCSVVLRGTVGVADM